MKNLIILIFISILNFYSIASKTQYTIDAKGYTSGIQSNSTDKSEIFFDLADKEIIHSARLYLNGTYSSLLNDKSYIRVLINDIPLATKQLNKGKYSFSYNPLTYNIVIPKSYIKDGPLKLTIVTNADIGSSKCGSNKINTNNLINILPSTGLIVKYKNTPKNISNHLKSLNKSVTLYLGKSYLSSQYFDLIYYLRKSGHDIRVIKDITDKEDYRIDISLASKQENRKLSEQIDRRFRQIREERKEFSSSLEMRHYKEFDTLFLNSDINEGPRYFLSLVKYRDILKTQNLDHFDMKDNRKALGFISRDQLGIDSRGNRQSSGINWSFNINPANFKEKKMPKSLEISIVSTPSLTDIPTRMSVFQNEQLLKVIELSNSGHPQSYSIGLTKHIKTQTSTYNILVQFDDNKGECGGTSDISNASLLPDTKVTLDEYSTPAASLAEVNYTLTPNIDVYLPKGLARETIIYNLYSLINSYGINPLKIEFKTYSKKLPKELDRSFFVVTHKESLDEVNAPITSGTITKFQADNANTELAYFGLDNITVTQLVNKNNFTGINVHYLNKIRRSKIDYITFDSNDIIISDKNSLLLRLNSKDPNSNIPIFSKQSFLKSIYIKYKYIIFFIAWLILTLIFIKLGQRANE